MRDIEEALVSGRNFVYRGQNMSTGRRGERYHITSAKNTFYWGSKVASLGPKGITISTCGYWTKTTLLVINTAIKAWSELKQTNQLFHVVKRRGNLFLIRASQKVPWDGEETTIF